MLSVRARTLADCSTVVEWIPDADALYLFTGPEPEWPLTASKLAEIDGKPGHSAWVINEADVAGRDPSTAGHFDLSLTDGVARLGRVIVDPDRRGQGLAYPLVQFAITTARALGATEITLNVIVGNAPAIRTYERAGFVALPLSKRPDVIAMRGAL